MRTMIVNQSQRAGEERRAAGRGRPVLRIAKIVCATGEYPCILRDVSTTGAGLSFHGDVPPDARAILQLPDGLTFPIERVWSEADRAGYRFAVPVEEEDFIARGAEFGQRPLRLSIRAAASIVDGTRTQRAQLLDLSAQGAKLEFAPPHGAASYGTGRVVSLALAGRDPRLAEVRWRDDATLGLRFLEPLTGAELGALALALQPFAGADGEDAATRAA